MDIVDTVEADRTAPEADQADRAVKPWTIKGISPDIRNAAIAAAEREEQTLGEWFNRAIPAMIQQQRAQTRLPTVVLPPVEPGRPLADLGDIERVIAVMASLHAVSSQPPPKTLVSLANGLLREHLRSLAPAPSNRKRPRSGPPAGQADRADQTAAQADPERAWSDPAA